MGGSALTDPINDAPVESNAEAELEQSELADRHVKKAGNALEELILSQLKQHHATVTAALDKRVIGERLKREVNDGSATC